MTVSIEEGGGMGYQECLLHAHICMHACSCPIYARRDPHLRPAEVELPCKLVWVPGQRMGRLHSLPPHLQARAHALPGQRMGEHDRVWVSMLQYGMLQVWQRIPAYVW
jgi:hypothetical protein